MAPGGKKGRGQNSRKTRRTPAPPKPPAPLPQVNSGRGHWSVLPNWWRQVAAWIGWIVAGASALATVLSLLPRLSVTAESPLRPSDPLSAPFLLTNDGQAPVHDVSWTCILYHVEGTLPTGPGGSQVPSVVEGLALYPIEIEFHSIAPSETVTLACNSVSLQGSAFPIQNITEALITLQVGYWPWLLPNWQIFWRIKAATFTVVRDPTGAYRWVPTVEPKPGVFPYSVRPIDPFPR